MQKDRARCRATLCTDVFSPISDISIGIITTFTYYCWARAMLQFRYVVPTARLLGALQLLGTLH